MMREKLTAVEFAAIGIATCATAPPTPPPPTAHRAPPRTKRRKKSGSQPIVPFAIGALGKIESSGLAYLFVYAAHVLVSEIGTNDTST